MKAFIKKFKHREHKTTINDLNLFSILIFDGKYNPTEKLKLNLESFKVQYPGMTHHLLFKDEVREIISNHFDSDVLEAFDKLGPYAYKTDLARLCVLYKFGGIYSDISHIHLSPINVGDDIRMVFFRDIGLIHPPFALSTSVIFSRPGQKELLNIIDLIVTNTKNDFYGSNPLDVTGPYLWGRYFATLKNFDGIYFGDSVQTSHGIPEKSTYSTISKYMPDGKLISIRNKSKDSSVEEFLSGGNNYGRMWKKRKVYTK